MGLLGDEDPSDPLAFSGLGLGASPRAKQLVLMGRLSERLYELDTKLAELKPKMGRPRKDPYYTLDAARAFAVWRMCKGLRDTSDNPKAKITTRELIRVIQLVERETGVDGHEQLFNRDDKSNEQSVARGKKRLEVDADWNSKVCEELWRTFPHTT